MVATRKTDNVPQRVRWNFLMQGVFATVVGFGLFLFPATTVATIALVLGFFWFLRGLAMIITLFADRRNWGWKVFVGLFGIAAGVVAMTLPLYTATVFVVFAIYFIAIQALLTGVTELFYGLRDGSSSLAVLGGLSVLLGAALLIHPWIGAQILALTIGLLALFGGIFAIVAALWPEVAARRIAAA